MENLNHLRAKFAKKCVEEVIEDKEVAGRFKSYVTSAPSLILKNGLGNTLAFYKTKFEAKDDKEKNAENKAYEKLYKCIDKWLRERGYCTEDILECVINMDNIKFASATEEVLAMLNWMKMLVKAKITERRE